MKKIQIKIINSDISSSFITDYLKHLNKNIEIFYDNGNVIKILSSISSSAILNDLHKKFDVDFEVREI